MKKRSLLGTVKKFRSNATTLMRKRKKKVQAAAALVTAGVFLFPQIALANEGFDPVESMGKMTDLVLTLITGIGICLLAFGVLNLAMSFQSHDDSQKSRGVGMMVGGFIAIGLRVVLQFLGVAV
ncbi:MAG TPA: hypothetical protein DEB31_11330 [Clostridiales bacterium]|nr:hypothetical protein [Clostridiales bacterium]